MYIYDISRLGVKRLCRVVFFLVRVNIGLISIKVSNKKGTNHDLFKPKIVCLCAVKCCNQWIFIAYFFRYLWRFYFHPPILKNQSSQLQSIIFIFLPFIVI